MSATNKMKSGKHFCELIKVSVGLNERLSKEPTEQLWQTLFDMAQQQALTGVCFAGVHRLKDQGANIPQQLYYEWLGMAGMIQQQNERLNRESRLISQLVSEQGFRSSILKGQAVAKMYDGVLKTLRQPGDIDIWVTAKPKEVIRLGRSLGCIYYYDYHHADLEYYKDTEVEMHYRPTLSRNLWRNRRLQRWFEKEGESLVVYDNQLGFNVPRPDFNLILTLNHNFWHLLYEGVGMRQMMDLYYVLKSHTKITDNTDIEQLLKYFGLMKFVKACMWVMQEVFGLARNHMVCEPDERSGRFLLNEIMTAGNFGHHDPRLKRSGEKSRVVLMGRWLKHTIRLFRYYPADVLWTPFGVLYISLWRRWHYMRDKQIHYDKR